MQVRLACAHRSHLPSSLLLLRLNLSSRTHQLKLSASYLTTLTLSTIHVSDILATICYVCRATPGYPSDGVTSSLTHLISHYMYSIHIGVWIRMSAIYVVLGRPLAYSAASGTRYGYRNSRAALRSVVAARNSRKLDRCGTELSWCKTRLSRCSPKSLGRARPGKPASESVCLHKHEGVTGDGMQPRIASPDRSPQVWGSGEVVEMQSWTWCRTPDRNSTASTGR
ncbi:hypothetical protein DM02DRAFT_109198 [Periconia macrospinosa]|uniref:Uncharacterized protein n=1 Tax=Periconia macrospinosa TaxID=97972 RepID=A0A2V1E4C8_9PLEO|nr:hypothetical protein DM02DRAFT_109198 [Periconia macrospinosa]